MEGLTIAQAAARAGISVHAARYYESAGMVPRVPRDDAGRRVFDADSVAWLEYAACLRALGMTVRQVAEYVGAAASGAPGAEALAKMRSHLELMKQRRAELDDYIALVEAKVTALENGR